MNRESNGLCGSIICFIEQTAHCNHKPRAEFKLWLGLKEATGSAGGTQKGEYRVAPLMTGQPPVVVVCSRTPKRPRFV